MDRLSHIVFWQNILSPLQVPYIKEVALFFSGKVRLVVPQELTQSRIDIGWSVPSCSPAELFVNPSANTVSEIFNATPEESYHFFSGLRGYQFVWDAFRASLKVDTKRALISEAGKWRGPKGVLRIVRGQADAMRYGEKINLIFAVGSLAEKWFHKCGFPKNKIKRFGYFTEMPKTIAAPSGQREPFRIIFIGQCIKRKGIDILLKALASLKQKDWCLSIVGVGEYMASLKSLCQLLQLNSRVHFLGAKKNSEAMELLEHSDLLVLPSRWDGWGAVISESLSRGVPVVCSDSCGASELICTSDNGRLFSTGSVESLTNELAVQIDAGKPGPKIRNSIRQWANRISAATAANYFLKIVYNDGDIDIAPPWNITHSGK